MEGIVFLIGAPGSGKGTLGRQLSNDYGLYQLSVGDYLRELSRDEGSHLEQTTRGYLQRGELLPNEIILTLLRQKVQDEIAKGHFHFLIDGFPRDLSQALDFEKTVGSPNLSIVLHCPKDVAKERFLSRNLPGRVDDDAETFEKRFNEFAEKQPKILDHYRTLGITEEIDSSTETKITYGVLKAALEKNNTWVMTCRAEGAPKRLADNG
ncbi:hypothetical protein AJ80_08404 [Polytolypa hystricis UAMH7299]|uniref:Adenylate kinase active site lid domain-containing protein n=1 Tax=Polytolypa hystricis (strain UAMH7299) TaxID=1447883 RepID=A0A2B7X812_POLH7|nr:hypothetical protein AJ80_08404 [Polytolypa hystricis UAMH7299]